MTIFQIKTGGYMNEKLVELIQRGQDVRENMQLLYTDILPLIRRVASKYKGYGEMEDLVQQGYLALVDAVRDYDPERGVFINFFCMVYEQNINEYLAVTGQCVRVPTGVRSLLRQYHEWSGKGFTLGEIAEKMEISLRRVQELAALDAGAASMYSPVGEDGCLLDLIAAEPEEPDTDLSGVWSAVSDNLDAKRSRIVYDLYRQGVTVREEAEKMGVSKQAISAMMQKAFERLRKVREIRNLAEMADIDLYSHVSVGYFKQTGISAVEFAVLHRERIAKAEEKCHNEWLEEFTMKKAAFYEQYGIK